MSYRRGYKPQRVSRSAFKSQRIALEKEGFSNSEAFNMFKDNQVKNIPSQQVYKDDIFKYAGDIEADYNDKGRLSTSITNPGPEPEDYEKIVKLIPRDMFKSSVLESRKSMSDFYIKNRLREVGPDGKVRYKVNADQPAGTPDVAMPHPLQTINVSKSSFNNASLMKTAENNFLANVNMFKQPRFEFRTEEDFRLAVGGRQDEDDMDTGGDSSSRKLGGGDTKLCARLSAGSATVAPRRRPGINAGPVPQAPNQGQQPRHTTPHGVPVLGQSVPASHHSIAHTSATGKHKKAPKTHPATQALHTHTGITRSVPTQAKSSHPTANGEKSLTAVPMSGNPKVKKQKLSTGVFGTARQGRDHQQSGKGAVQATPPASSGSTGDMKTGPPSSSSSSQSVSSSPAVSTPSQKPLGSVWKAAPGTPDSAIRLFGSTPGSDTPRPQKKNQSENPARDP